MHSVEPFATALLLSGLGVLVLLAVVFSRASRVLGIPVVLLFLAVGMLAGSDGIGRIRFEDLDSPSGSGPSRWR